MPILNSMTTAQIQMTLHFLQEIESGGVPDLATARLHLQREAESRRREMRLLAPRVNRTPPPPAQLCPECGRPMTDLLADDTDGDGNVVAVVEITQCKSCRWSAIVVR